MDEIIDKFMNKLKNENDFDRVKFVILYGSQANGKSNKMSDYDISIYYEGDKKERFKFRVKMQSSKLIDVQVFQDIPIYMKKEVLKGKVLYVKDINFLYDVAYMVIREHQRFKKYVDDYTSTRKVLWKKEN